MKTAFVTGGTGFLGLNLISLLKKNDWKVIALHRPNSDLTYLKIFDVELVTGSLREVETLIDVMPDNLDAVFHVAGNTSMWSKNNDAQYQDNVLGTKNMVSVALARHAKRFIYTSSVAAFGVHTTCIDEQTPSNAKIHQKASHYALTKYLGEEEVKKGVLKGLEAVILNPCHILGAYDQHNWVQLIQGIYQENLAGIPSGEGMFCDAKHVAQAHLTAVSQGKTGENYLLGGVSASFLTLINEIEQQLGKKGSKKITPDWMLELGCLFYGFQSFFTQKEPQITPEKLSLVTEKVICNDEKAQTELNYQHSTLEKMIRDAISWLQENDKL